MRRGIWALHLLVFLGWLGWFLHESVAVAVLGTEQVRLEMQMGADRDQRQQAAYELSRLQAQLDQQVQPLALQALVRQLQLPLQTPDARLALVGRSPEP